MCYAHKEKLMYICHKHFSFYFYFFKPQFPPFRIFEMKFDSFFIVISPSKSYKCPIYNKKFTVLQMSPFVDFFVERKREIRLKSCQNLFSMCVKLTYTLHASLKLTNSYSCTNNSFQLLHICVSKKPIISLII